MLEECLQMTHRIHLIEMHNELKRGKSPFWQDNALFVSKANINVFLRKKSNIEWRVPEKGTKLFFSKTLILVFG